MKKRLIFLMLPIFVFVVWIGMLAVARYTGTQVILPVQGFDPRDILAGQYLALRVNYGSEKCLKRGRSTNYFCVDTKQFSPKKPSCSTFIKGECRWGTFFDNISRFYIPEKDARALENAVRSATNKPELLLSVTKEGVAYPIDLLLDGKPWKTWLQLQKAQKK